MTGGKPKSSALSTLRKSLSEEGVAATTRTIVDYARWRMRSDTVTRQLRALRSEPWMPAMQRAQAAVWDAGDSYYRSRYQTDEIHYWTNVARWLHEHSLALTEVRAVDVGSGFGTLAVYMTELFGTPSSASDMHRRDSVDILEKRGLLKFRPCNIELDPFPFEGQFDVIVFTEILEHLNFDPVPTLLKLRTALSDRGRLFLSTPDSDSWGRVTTFYESPDQMPSPEEGVRLMEAGEWSYIDDHVWQYSWDELQAVLARAGLEVVRSAHAPGVAYRHFNIELKKGLLVTD